MIPKNYFGLSMTRNNKHNISTKLLDDYTLKRIAKVITLVIRF